MESSEGIFPAFKEEVKTTIVIPLDDGHDAPNAVAYIVPLYRPDRKYSNSDLPQISSFRETTLEGRSALLAVIQFARGRIFFEQPYSPGTFLKNGC